MTENREVILADFQACTGIEDVAEAIYHLDETNWDLLRAVGRVMPPDSQAFNTNSTPDVMIVDEPESTPASSVEMATDMASVGNNVGHSLPRLSSDDDDDVQLVQPSTSSERSSGPRMLRFNVQYCDRIVHIDIPETGTVADIKLRLHRELKIPPCRQMLSGWARMKEYNNTPLSQLMLPKENALLLSVKTNEGGLSAEDESEITERLQGNYTLKIKFESDARKENYNLKYNGTKTILDIKTDLYTLTNVPVRHQVWSGWPPNIDDQTMIALSGISYPEHEFTLRPSVAMKSETREKRSGANVVQIDSDDDEFEDASESFNVEDDYFVENVGTKRTEPLIPDNVEDEIVGSISFCEQFTARYGPVHPAFYQGTLDDAIKEACTKPAKDRKILAIYLHHDASVLSNVFCTELLGFESVMQLFEQNFILWGWDLTFESNRTKLQQAVNNTLGSVAAMSLRMIAVDRLPAIVIIMKIRSSTDIYTVIHGNVGVNELLSSLIEAVEVFTQHQKVEIREEQERAERELVKWEQDQAYRESLEADRAKEEAKRQQAEAETQARKRIELEKAEEEAKREAYRKQVEASLPPEPTLSEGDTITKIRFRLPKGEHLERTFHIGTPLKVLLDFLIVKGYPTEQYKVISSWPRRDLTSLDSSKTLQELNLFPQETVILEER